MAADIHCNQLCKSYQRQPSLTEVSLTLEKQLVTGILGINGAGKSTLIKSILGLIRPDSGNIAKPVNIRIGYLPELAQMPASMSAWQLIQFALQLHNCATDSIESLLERVRLQRNYWHKPLRSYSKGMRQRVALAYAIAGTPDWIILDEPMSGLDALGRKEFLDILNDMHKQGAGILVCSHIVPDLVRLCGRILLMHRGKIAETVTIHQHSMDEARQLEERLAKIAEHSNA
jgi:ABC-2 type transport system ATP-binding protein